MRLFILAGLALMLVLCACQNTLDIKDPELEGVQSSVLINRHLLKIGDSYAPGYANGNIRSDRVTISWTRCTDENFLSYKLFRNDDHIKDIVNPAIISFTDSLLQHNHVYDYRLICFLKNGMAVDDTIQIKTPQFQPPNQLNYEFLTPTSLYLTWNNRAESAVSFEIEKYIYATNLTETYTSDTESYTDNLVTQGNFYRYRVRAVNPFEQTAWSGWLYIDTSFVYNFEANDGGFISNNPDGWQWGEDAVAGSYSGQHVWGTVLEGDYPNSVYLWLRSPMLEISDDMVLEFYHWYEIENNWDGGNVKISIDGGQSWVLITPNGGYPYANINSFGQPGYSGFHSNWTRAVFDLSAYAGESAMFRWEFTTDTSVTARGWYIDNVRIGPETDKKLVR